MAPKDGDIVAALSALSERLGSIETKLDVIEEVKAMLQTQNGRVATIEKQEAACYAVVQDIPKRLDGLDARVRTLEEWRQARGEDIPKRVNELEGWRDKAEGSLGLVKWALGGGLIGVAGLLAALFDYFSKH